MTTAGAQAALRGYRLQALYILHRLLNAEPWHVFQPEGDEDLDVLGKDGELLEAIQVKAYDGNLTLSKFDLRKPSSFFRRVLSRHNASPSTTERIMCLGPIGPSMQRAWESDGPERAETIQSFIAAGYTLGEANTLLLCVKLEQIDITAIEAAVYSRLRDSLVGVDPTSAFSLLHAWVYTASEAKQRIKQTDLHNRIAAVGRFVGERDAHHDEWFRTIAPLTLDGFTGNTDSLRTEFFSGISARYEHIQANVDVHRPRPLQSIDDAFGDCRLVVVHGASGQGKTALAYRYLHDFAPEAWRFEVRLIESRAHALKISQALLGHLNAVGAPAYLYVDVAPGETHWLELARMLAAYPLVRVLVTIREEDWNRTISPRASVSMCDIELRFDKAEAEEIYGKLSAQVAPVHVLTFEDAWSRFGNAGPLLEFVHFVAQSETLIARLSAQVLRLRDELRQGRLHKGELELLRRAAVATACGGRLNLVVAVSELNLADPARTVDIFEREFLVRLATNRQYIEGLHPIRSELLANLLTDDVFNPWIAVAARVLPAIIDADLEWFLLHALARHPHDDTFLRCEIGRFVPRTWTAGVGILRVLLWLGVRQYAKTNDLLIREVRSKFGVGWSIILAADVGNVAAVAPGLMTPMLEQFEWITTELRAEYAAFRSRLTPSHVLDDARVWLLEKSGQFQEPRDDRDWGALAEAAFWIGHLDIASRLAHVVPVGLFGKAANNLPLELAADVAFGLSYVHTAETRSALAEVNAGLIERFQNETDTPAIEDDDKVVCAHFLVDPRIVWSDHQQSEQKRDYKNPVLDEAMRRVNLLRRIMPQREVFGCQGYGHNLDVLPLNGDDSTKRIPSGNLPPPWPLRLNITLIRLVDYAFRPEHWDAYAREVLAKRGALVRVLDMVSNGVAAYFRDPKRRDLFGCSISSEDWERSSITINTTIPFPKVAVDQWGQVTEAGTLDNGDSGTLRDEYIPSLERHEPYRKALSAYVSPMSNFYHQAVETLVVVPYYGRAKNAEHREALRAEFQKLHGRPDRAWLSMTNLFNAWQALPVFQAEFRRRFEQYVSASELSALEDHERTAIRRTFATWHQFVSAPNGRIPHAVAESEKRLFRSLDNVRRQLSGNLKRLRTVGIFAKIRSESVAWKGKSALWITMDVMEPQALFDAFGHVYEAIADSFRSLLPHELSQYAVLQSWETIHILPLTTGRLLEVASWQIPSVILAGQAEQEEIPWWRVALLALPVSILDQLNIPAPNWPSLDIFDRATNGIRELLVVVSSFKSVMGIPEPTGGGGDVLRRYSEEQSREVNTLIASTQRAMSDVVDHVATISSRMKNREDVVPEHAGAQLKLTEAGMPLGLFGDSTDQDVISSENVVTWQEALTSALVNIQTLRLSWLSYLVSDAGRYDEAGGI